MTKKGKHTLTYRRRQRERNTHTETESGEGESWGGTELGAIARGGERGDTHKYRQKDRHKSERKTDTKNLPLAIV